MTVSDVISLTPWQQRVYETVGAALDGGRLGHALLFCGPAMLGKRAVAERLAQRVLCPSPRSDGEPCGHCRSCTLFAQRHQHDPAETRPDGSLAHPFGRPGHPDYTAIGFAVNDKARPPKIRAEIVIDQIRDLSAGLALTSRMGGVQVAIIDPADAINHAARNALLKTLEEPQPGRYLWLVCDDPARLSATIRSRCQRIEFRTPPRDEALAWLAAQNHGDAEATEALDAARGHPGLANAWLRGDGMALRRAVADDLGELARDAVSAVDVARRWTADNDAVQRLRHAADLALAQAAGLTDQRRMRKLAEWFDAANRTRELLRTTIRADLAVAELLLQWRDTTPGATPAARRGR